MPLRNALIQSRPALLVIESVDFCAPFLLADDTGAVRVDLSGFTLDVETVQRSTGNVSEAEIALAPGDALYVMGACEAQGNALQPSDDRLAHLVVLKPRDR